MGIREADRDDVGRREFAHSESEWLEQAIRIRDRRLALFGSELFADPAWDIILFLARPENSAGASLDQVTSAIAASRETVRRWLLLLLDRNHVELNSTGIFKLSEASRQALPGIYR